MVRPCAQLLNSIAVRGAARKLVAGCPTSRSCPVKCSSSFERVKRKRRAGAERQGVPSLTRLPLPVGAYLRVLLILHLWHPPPAPLPHLRPLLLTVILTKFPSNNTSTLPPEACSATRASPPQCPASTCCCVCSLSPVMLSCARATISCSLALRNSNGTLRCSPSSRTRASSPSLINPDLVPKLCRCLSCSPCAIALLFVALTSGL